MKVVEKFISVNGEGTHAGELAVFIRFKGCNLRCSYCDTMWANEASCPCEEMSPKEIASYIQSTGIHNVTLTGGEPLLQKELPKLLKLLKPVNPALRIEIETNGAVDLSPFCGAHRPVFTMDYKLPSSGCENQMLRKNFSFLHAEDTVKFVSGTMEDLEKAAEIIREYHLTERCHVYISPVFGSIEPTEIVNYMMEQKLNHVRLQIQLHKIIWDPDRRGV